MDIEELKAKVLNLISLKQEGSYWDFKREWYENKVDLLHDIVCMANNLSKQDSLIIIGIDEENDYQVKDVINDINRKNTQKIVDFLKDKKFAGGIRPTVYVQPISLDEKIIDVIVILNDRNTPYYLTEKYRDVVANNIYTRVQDTNTSKNSSADINIVENLWKKRFGINATAFERVMLYLQNPKDWIELANVDGSYYKYAPEFVIKKLPASEERNGYEFYLFSQTDSFPYWYDINLYYHQTLINYLGGVALDGGRCFSSTPKTEVLNLDRDNSERDISYRYFIKGSIDYIVHRFYVTDDRDEEKTARKRFLECVLIFNSEAEKERFDNFVDKNYSNYNPKDFEKRLPIFSEKLLSPEIGARIKSSFRKKYLDALTLKKMLVDFRVIH